MLRTLNSADRAVDKPHQFRGPGGREPPCRVADQAGGRSRIAHCDHRVEQVGLPVVTIALSK